MRVTVDGKGGYIMVRFDGPKYPLPCHPTWRVVYHTPEGDKAFGLDQPNTQE